MADVSGPDDSLATAYGPMQPGVTVAGTFTTPTDVDYLSFVVSSPNTAVHFDIANTATSCTSPDGPAGCAVWGTLIDSQQQQLGGEGSSAGTAEVDAGRHDVIDWTIATPGTYYLAMDSGGSLPSYTARLAPPKPTGPVIAALSARSIHHGHAVRAVLRAGRPLRSARADLSALIHGHRVTIGHVTRGKTPQGSVTLTITVNAAGRRALAASAKGRLAARVTVTAKPAVGKTATARRAVTLHR
jgi:hypothetical protein